MKAKDLYINDEFQIRGQWFLPSEEEKPIGGILYYSSAGIKLELQDVLIENDVIFETYKFDYVLGNCENGFKVTLVDGFEVNRQTNIIQTSKVIFNRMFIGDHFKKDEDLKFHQINFKYTFLEEWFNDKPFRVITPPNGQIEEFTIHYKQPEKNFIVNIDSVDAILEGSNYCHLSYSPRQPKVVHENTIIIKPFDGNPRSIEWFDEVEVRIRQMLAFFMNRAVHSTQIICKSRLNVSDIYLFKYSSKIIKPKKLLRTNNFIALNDIKDDLENIVNIWFDERYSNSIKNYIRNIYGNSDGVDVFLRYTKVLESIHRETVEEAVYMPRKKYNQIKKEMISSIEDLVNEEFKVKLSNDLIRSYQYEFKKKIKYYLDNLNGAIKETIFFNKDIDDFSKRITRTRNYYTHYGKKQEGVFEELELYYINVILKIISFYWVSKTLLFDDDFLEKQILNDDNLIQRAKEARNFF